MIVGHSHFANEDISRYVFVFHLSVFYVCSGWLLNTDVPFGKFMKKNFMRLIVPYLVYNLLAAALLVGAGLLTLWQGGDPEWGLRLYDGTMNTLCGYAREPFCVSSWFLLSLFWCRTFGYLLVKGGRGVRLTIVAFWLLLGYVRYVAGQPYYYALDSALMGLVWFMVGVVIRRRMHVHLHWSLRALLIPLGFVASFAIYRSIGACDYIDSNPNGLLGLVGTSLALVAFFSLCSLLGNIESRVVQAISKATLFIMCVHVMILPVAEKVVADGDIFKTFIIDLILICVLTWAYKGIIAHNNLSQIFKK